jgi:hypothetical protein
LSPLHPNEDLPLVLLFLLVFLVPLALYFLILAGINRRQHPMLVWGVWDCVGLLFAASGFLLIVVPGMLGRLYAKSLLESTLDESTHLSGFLAVWWGVWLVYYCLLAAGAALLLRGRRRTSIIYNITSEDFHRLFSQIVSRLGLEPQLSGKHIRLTLSASNGATAIDTAAGTTAGPISATATAAVPSQVHLQIDPFPALCNVTLHWEKARSPLRDRFEAELGRSLQEIYTHRNPAGAWFLGIGLALIGVVLMLVGGLVLLSLIASRIR